MEPAKYTSTRIGVFRARINPAYDSPGLRETLGHAPELFDAHDSIVFRDSRSTRAGFVELDLGQGKKTCFLKEAKSRGFYYSLSRGLGTCRVFRGFKVALSLSAAGFPTPVPIAALLEKKMMTFKRAFYLTEGCPGTLTFREFASRKFPDLKREARSRFLLELGKTLGKLHEHGVEHGDMKSTNILVDVKADGTFGVIFTDLEGTKPGPVGRDGTARDMGRLAYNFPVRGFPWTEALRVLRGYIAARPGFPATWREVLWDAERQWKRCTTRYGKLTE